ncbi:cyclophilin-like fold protein [Arthrobacter sp. 31Y]|uniref:cyclophilin-like fold protein n=1 Tax=Arthrobacter sp. 31Y TaxID=1115632 RepID=UPI000466FD2D|nr:cyclophilin-like fold protein [Arthrobacter sp. 31Y]
MKRLNAGVLLLGLTLAVPLASCSDGSRPTEESSPAASPTAGSGVGTVVRFSTGSASLDVTIGEDNAATRDFLSMLPLTLTMEEFAGREKIADLPRTLHHEGSPGSDPEDGDLIYFVPWGNLGFYYDASGIGFSDQTVHVGRYKATREELARFEGQEVRVEVSR